MNDTPSYRGVIVPLVTPLDAAGDVDREGVVRLVDSVRGDVSALMPTLSTGEGWKLAHGQWRTMVETVVACAGSLPVLVGVQLTTTEPVIVRAREAVALGASAVVVPPPFGQVSQEAVFDHYQRVVAETGARVFLYNEAELSGTTIELDTLLRICQLAGIVGIKESSGSAEFTRKLLETDLGIPVFEGWENLLYEVRGVAGFIGPLANVEPQLCMQMLEHPSAELQNRINAACTRYGLFRDDWYRWLKQELHARKIISTDRIVEEGES
ncbi:MAG TPA: dihydrodipicolinate synthase family protein [Micromonosporaceae bacterium]